MKRTVSLLLALCLTLLFSCASAQEQVHLTFWDNNPGEFRTPLYEKLIADFEALYPHIDVEYVGIPWSSAYEKFQVAITTGTTPDCGVITQSWLGGFVAQDALLALDDYLATWEELPNIPASVLQSARDTAPDGKVYQLFSTYNMDLFWYRADVLTEKGITLNTWEDFFAAMPQLTDLPQGIYGHSIRGGAGSIPQLQSLLMAYSGMTSYFDEKGVCAINNEKAVEFLEKYAGLYKVCTPESDINNAYKEMVAAFDSGIAMTILHNLGSYGEHSKSLQPGQFAAMALLPCDAGYRVIKSGDFSGYAAFAGTQHPQETWQFLSYMAGAQQTSYWNEAVGQLPVNTVALEDAWVKERQHTLVAAQVLSDPNTRLCAIPTYLPAYGDIVNGLAPAFQDVLMGVTTPRAFLNQWAEEMTAAYAEYKAQ